jgi:hypothetical protein
MKTITHRQVKMMLKIFPSGGEPYVKSFIASSLEKCRALAEEHLDNFTQPGTRVIHMTTHYVPLQAGEDI